MSIKPNSATSQLPLDLPVSSAGRREDLIESPANSTAIAMMDAWPDWPGSITVLAGPVGSGKTHIGQVWAAQALAFSCSCKNLSKQIDRLVEHASSGGSILIEDVDRGSVDEAALFHLSNAIRQGKGYCLITSRSWPLEWGIKLPDLRSRMRAAQVVELLEPDDILLRQVMVKLFADRQLMVEPKIVDYCVLRMERSLESAGCLVAEIDSLALAEKSPISRTLAAKALDNLGMK